MAAAPSDLSRPLHTSAVLMTKPFPESLEGSFYQAREPVKDQRNRRARPERVDNQQRIPAEDLFGYAFPQTGLLRIEFDSIEPSQHFTGTATVIARDGHHHCLLTCAHNVVEYQSKIQEDAVFANYMWFELRENTNLSGSRLIRRYDIVRIRPCPLLDQCTNH